MNLEMQTQRKDLWTQWGQERVGPMETAALTACIDTCIHTCVNRHMHTLPCVNQLASGKQRL